MSNDGDFCWGFEHGHGGDDREGHWALPLSKEPRQSTAQLTFLEIYNENPFVVTAIPHETDCRCRAVGSCNSLKPTI